MDRSLIFEDENSVLSNVLNDCLQQINRITLLTILQSHFDVVICQVCIFVLFIECLGALLLTEMNNRF